MKFLLITLITHTGPADTTRARFREVVDNAVLAEELGFDGDGVGERHERPFISSSPPVVLSHIAARTPGSGCSPRSPRSACSTRCAPTRTTRRWTTSRTDAIERSSILVGSPQQIIDKIHRYHAEFGHEVMHLHADGDGLTEKQHRATLELFQSEIAPVLRRDIPSRPFGGDQS